MRESPEASQAESSGDEDAPDSTEAYAGEPPRKRAKPEELQQKVTQVLHDAGDRVNPENVAEVQLQMLEKIRELFKGQKTIPSQVGQMVLEQLVMYTEQVHGMYGDMCKGAEDVQAELI